MSKKVNIYYAGFKHRIGGAYFHALNLAKGLEEKGYLVQIITLDNLPFIIQYIPHMFQKIGNVVDFPMGFFYKQKVIRFFYKIFFKNSADIEIFEDIYTYWNSDKPSIVVLHALWSDNLQALHVSEQQRIKLEKKESEIMNKIKTNIVTVSIPYRKFLMSRLQPAGFKNDIGVVELGVDTSKFSKRNNKNKSIIYSGSLEGRKNIKFLLSVFVRIQKFHNYTLTLVGDGPQTKELKQYVRKNDIINVEFLGRLSYEAVIKELPKHQYYMHTSTKESFSYSLLQAKLSGLVTIAYGGLEVPNEFIDIKMDSFGIEEWVEKILSIDTTPTDFDCNKYTYQVTAKNTLEKIK